MDSTYCWQCQQIGVVPHPLLLRHFCDSTNPVLVLGGRNDDVDPPVRDADLVASSLVLRSLSRTNRLPSVRLDLSGELITCDGLRTIAAVLQVGSLPLRSLLLRRSHVADNGAAALGAVLSSSQLMELDLGECAITDVGLRYLMRGPQVHGAPPCLSVLLLDGNATGDAGTIEVISFLERERTTLANLSVQPALPRFLSQEVEAALQVQLRLGFWDFLGRISGGNVLGIENFRMRIPGSSGRIQRIIRGRFWSGDMFINTHTTLQIIYIYIYTYVCIYIHIITF